MTRRYYVYDGKRQRISAEEYALHLRYGVESAHARLDAKRTQRAQSSGRGVAWIRSIRTGGVK